VASLAGAVRNPLEAAHGFVGGLGLVGQAGDVLAVLGERPGFGLQVENAAHGGGIIFRQGDALAGGGLGLEAVLAVGQLVELGDSVLGKVLAVTRMSLSGLRGDRLLELEGLGGVPRGGAPGMRAATPEAGSTLGSGSKLTRWDAAGVAGDSGRCVDSGSCRIKGGLAFQVDHGVQHLVQGGDQAADA